MKKTIISIILLFIMQLVSNSSVKNSEPVTSIVSFTEKLQANEEKSRLNLIIKLKNSSRFQFFGRNNSELNDDLIRINKEKANEYVNLKNNGIIERHTDRNDEKVNLVRNRTFEILKNGVKILSAGENYSFNEKKMAPAVNGTLLEKIMSTAASKPNILLSTKGSYKIPIGVKIYEKISKPETNEFHVVQAYTEKSSSTFSGNKHLMQTNPQKRILNLNENHKKEYNSYKDSALNLTKASHRVYTVYNSDSDLEAMVSDHQITSSLEQITIVMKNFNECSNKNCSRVAPYSIKGLETVTNGRDPCQKWLECDVILENWFHGVTKNLPSCPCQYPSTIFYENSIWDERQKKYFRWRDASSEAERLDIYKPGATYCIRSILTQGSSNVSSQQCCYDSKLQLLTRGSGAGTINFISPDISRTLHDKVDILPWRLCKGDFTRYNAARIPDNGNACLENPDEKHYQLQVKLSKVY